MNQDELLKYAREAGIIASLREDGGYDIMDSRGSYPETALGLQHLIAEVRDDQRVLAGMDSEASARIWQAEFHGTFTEEHHAEQQNPSLWTRLSKLFR